MPKETYSKSQIEEWLMGLKLHLDSTGGNRNHEDIALEVNPERLLKVERELSVKKRRLLISYLERIQDGLTWSYADMPGIDPQIAYHRLNLDPIVKLVK